MIEIGRSQVVVGRSGSQHMIGGDEDFVPDSDGGAHLAAAGAEATEFVLEVAAALFAGGDSCGDERRLEEDVAGARRAALVLAGAHPVAGADAGPRGEVGGT